MARARKTEEQKAKEKAEKQGPEKNGLLDAVKFVLPGYKEKGEPYSQHAMITGGWITSYDGVVQYGHPINLPFDALPHLGKLNDALKAAGTTQTKITQPNMDRLTIQAGGLRVTVPCLNDPTHVFRNAPHQAVAALDGRMRQAFEVMRKVVKKNDENAVAASVLMCNGSLVACDGKLAVQFVHNLACPQLTIPGDFIEAILRIPKALYCFGYNENSLTFFYEDWSYVRTQLYSFDYPDVFGVLPDELDKMTPIPPGIFEAVKRITPFAGAYVLFDEGKIKTDENEELGSTIELAGVPEVFEGIDHKNFQLLDGLATQWDLTTDDTRMFFSGENLRGTLVHRQHGKEREHGPIDNPPEVQPMDNVPQQAGFTNPNG